MLSFQIITYSLYDNFDSYILAGAIKENNLDVDPDSITLKTPVQTRKGTVLDIFKYPGTIILIS